MDIQTECEGGECKIKMRFKTKSFKKFINSLSCEDGIYIFSHRISKNEIRI